MIVSFVVNVDVDQEEWARLHSTDASGLPLRVAVAEEVRADMVITLRTEYIVSHATGIESIRRLG